MATEAITKQINTAVAVKTVFFIFLPPLI